MAEVVEREDETEAEEDGYNAGKRRGNLEYSVEEQSRGMEDEGEEEIVGR